ncbi:hypothetical protein HanPI659440_Chr08g0294211 [Helianthus annuus]|nr:hypothetical protein HanPI659440_Chr08g0294211 [Helianthus annuus]
MKWKKKDSDDRQVMKEVAGNVLVIVVMVAEDVLVAAVEEGLLDGMLREELAGTFKELKMLIVFCAGFDVCLLLEDVVYSLLLVSKS